MNLDQWNKAVDDWVERENACAQHVPFAVCVAAQSEGCNAHLMICNWMGDDGFLKSLDCLMKVAAAISCAACFFNTQ